MGAMYYKGWVTLFFLLSAGFFSVSAAKLDTLFLDDSSDDHPFFENHMGIYLDHSKSLTLEDVIQVDSFENPTEWPRIKYNATYWVKLIVKNTSTSGKRWVFENPDFHIQHFDYFIFNEKNQLIQKQSGFSKPFSFREYKHKNFIFDIPATYGKPQVIYLKIYSEYPDIFLFTVRSHKFFTKYSLNEYIALGFFYGILAIMILYNLLMYFSIREKVYIYYGLYVVSCAIMTFQGDGLGYQYLWPSHPEWNEMLRKLANLIFIITLYIYSSSFLKLSKVLPRFYKVAHVVAISYVVIYLLDSFYFHWGFSSNTFTIPSYAIYILSIVCYTKGYKAARFFIVGFSFLLLHFIYLVFKMHNIIEWLYVLSAYTFNLGVVFEVLIFSYAMSDRIKIMRKEREDALLENKRAQEKIIEQLRINEALKDKVNKELETKVKERTQALEQKTEELSQANTKLNDLYEELNKMAAQLDEKNWELQKKVKEETKARILSEEVSYDKFLKIFPDESSCQRYLEEIKWGSGFACKKCGHTKFSKGKELYSRKCNKCKYPESVTATTLFQGIKFPLNKAFYIVYSSTLQRNDLTIDELSDTLELRRNTCWAFKKKVMERRGELEKKFGVAYADKWENLLTG